MPAKIFEVSLDGTNWAVLPGNDASFDSEGEQLENTIFGSDFNSSITGIINHSFSGNALFRETAGYNARIRSTGEPVAFTDEATVENNGWYEIVDRDKSIWDHSEDVVVEDTEGVIDADDIKQIDHLHGRVRFVDGFTPDGAVTVSGDYLPTENFGCFRTFDLTQSSDTVETGCFQTIGDVNGYEFFKPTLRDVSLSAEGFYKESSDFLERLQGRERFIIEIDVEGDGENLARGYYSISTDGLSGGVGGDESESIDFTLSVPEGVLPFSWRFGSNSKAPLGLQWVIQAWEQKENIHYRYLPLGRDNKGVQAQAVITDCSISSSVDGLAEASVTGQGTGALTLLNYD